MGQAKIQTTTRGLASQSFCLLHFSQQQRAVAWNHGKAFAVARFAVKLYFVFFGKGNQCHGRILVARRGCHLGSDIIQKNNKIRALN
jgi:hypothetical protein